MGQYPVVLVCRYEIYRLFGYARCPQLGLSFAPVIY